MPRRIALLSDLIATVAEQAPEWVEVASEIKQLPPDSPLSGEEWLSGPYPVLATAAALRESLEALSRGGSPVDGYTVVRAPGGRVGVRVLPHSILDRLLFSGFGADVWMPPGVEGSTVRERAGLAQRTPTETRGIALVLGAGNVTSIGTLDVFNQLFAYNRVAILKLNPVTDPLRKVLERALAPLIERGFLEIVTGGADVGSQLAYDPRIAAVHMTGSAATYDASCLAPASSAANKLAGHQLLDKPITSGAGGRFADHRSARKMVKRRLALPGRARGHAKASQQRV